jgi:hypothetical protein
MNEGVEALALLGNKINANGNGNGSHMPSLPVKIRKT